MATGVQLMGHIFHKLLLILNIAINFVQEAIDVNVQVTPFVITAVLRTRMVGKNSLLPQVQRIIKDTPEEARDSAPSHRQKQGNY